MNNKLFMNNRVTIGLLVDSLPSRFTSFFWNEVATICEERDINLIIYPILTDSKSKTYGYQHNAILDFISTDVLDGIIILSNTITTFMDKEKLDQLLSKFNDVPKVSMGVVLANVSHTVMVDNKSGMMEAMEHLIVHHQYRRIAFLKGTENHEHTIERFNVYKEALEKYHIPYDEALVVSGDFFLESGIEAVRILYDERNTSFDVIVCSNDDMAIGVMQGLNLRGIQVPRDMRVTGFDNIKDVQFYLSPLATVSQPLTEMAESGISLLLDLIKGISNQTTKKVATKFVVRGSCGCLHKDKKSLRLHEEKTGHSPVTIEESRALIERILATDLRINRKYVLVIFEMLDNISEEIVNNDYFDPYLDLFTNLMNNGFMSDYNESNWIHLIEAMMDYTNRRLLGRDHLSGFDYFYENLREMISEAKQTSQIFDKIKNDRLVQGLMIDSLHNLMSAMDYKTLFKAIKNELPKVHINTCFLMLYDNSNGFSVIKEGDSISVPQKSVLKFGYCDNINYEINDEIFDTKRLIPHEKLLNERRYTLIVDPLYFAEQAYGYIVYELGVKVGSVYESIRRQICSAIKVINLLSEQEQANTRLQNAFDRVNQTQIQLVQAEKMAALGTLVAGVAHEINTPIGVGVSAASFLAHQSKELIETIQNNKLSKAEFEKYIKMSVETSDILLTNLAKAAELVSSFKNVAADQTSEEQRRFNVKDYLHQIIVSLRPTLKKNNVQVHLEGSEHLEIYSFPGAFAQIITNLVMNSVVHGFENRHEGLIDIVLSSTSNQLEIRFRDNGKGILPEHVERIFDPFFTTKRGEGGTGLGLNIVYNIMNQTFKGEVQCTSKVDVGTTFVLKFPLADKGTVH